MMTPVDGLVVGHEGALGRVILDRPKALNALTLTMVRGLTQALRGWAMDPAIGAVVLEGAGDRAFCAGGDIKSIYEADRSGGNATARTFWREEYVLDHLIATYPKPLVVLISGIVMGGGAGLAINARHRIVNETTLFAMPETGIGLFPDVGASRFLSRMPGEKGTFLALTGETIGADDMLATGLADIFVPRHRQADLLDRLDEAAKAGTGAEAAVATALGGLSEPVGHGSLMALPTLDQVFAADRVETILTGLDAEATDWASRTATTLRAKSPTSQKIALAALRRGRALPDLAAALAMEFRVVCRIAAGHDFYEGVRAAVIDKDRAPRWTPARLEDIADADIDAYFAQPGADELDL